jgi:transposase
VHMSMQSRREYLQVMHGRYRAANTKSERSVLGAGVVRLARGQRWTVARKREVVLRLLRGESAEMVSRELGVEIYRLERWRDKALSGIDAVLRERGGDPVQAELDAALKRIGELTMENGKRQIAPTWPTPQA